MTTALILQHGDDCPTGLLGEWARDREIAVTTHRFDLDPTPPELDGHAFVATLGSQYSPADEHVPEVAAESVLIAEAVRRGTPVLGLCFGGQMLAHTLGARIEPAPVPELGWHTIRSDAPRLVPEGPWLQWHYHRFTLPPGAEPLADSPSGLQAFTHGRHLGVQFHPESTIEIVRAWARQDADRLTELGIADGEAMLEQGRSHATAAAQAASTLFDAFWERARRP